MSNQHFIDHRLSGADVLKAISIFSVIFIHAQNLLPFQPSYTRFISYALSFCIPVLVVLWAYLLELGYIRQKNKTLFLLKHFYKHFYLFVGWSALYFVLYADFNGNGVWQLISKFWLGYGWSGQYYFIILFQLLLFYKPARWLCLQLKDNGYLLFGVAIIFYALVSYLPFFQLVLSKKFTERIVVSWIPYMMLGILCAHGRFQKKLTFPTGAAILLSAYIPLEVLLFHPGPGINLLPSVFIVTMVLANSFLIPNNAQPYFTRSNHLHLVSENVFLIFCLHPLVIFGYSYLVSLANFRLGFFADFIVVPLLSALVTMITCVVIVLILKKLSVVLLAPT